MTEAAPPEAVQLAADDEPTVAELFESCEELATRDDILVEVEDTARRAGFAGPTNALKIIVLAVVTRLFQRPVSVAPRGESSAGKSATIEHGLRFHPREAYVVMTGMSNKALAYWDDDLKHKILVAHETAGLAGEHLSYFMRSLLSEGHIDYRYTDFDRKTVVRIRKEGPTGLITSTAGTLDRELATRLITPSIADNPELTRAIMRTEALAAEGVETAVKYEEFHALNRWIAAGERRVVVPFATKIADAADARAVRMRRDFPALIALVQAHALMHKHSRDRDEAGRAVATIADYAVVHGLVAEMLAEAAERSVPESVRETVDAVDELRYKSPIVAVRESVSIAELADHIGLNRSTVSRRVNRAIGLGYLQDLQGGGKGKARELTAGDDLPEDVGVLPPPEALA